MAERGVDLTIFSPRASAMGHHFGDEAVGAAWARANNDLVARVVALHLGRFAAPHATTGRRPPPPHTRPPQAPRHHPSGNQTRPGPRRQPLTLERAAPVRTGDRSQLIGGGPSDLLDRVHLIETEPGASCRRDTHDHGGSHL
jgi:hypothetical protein